MPKAEWGVKRVCPTTGKRFYDLNKSPIISPYSGEVVDIEQSRRKSTATDYVNALGVIADSYAPIGALLSRHDLLICPTLGIAAPLAAFDSSTDEIRINGRVVDPFLGWAMTVPFNMLSRLPVLAVPSGHAGNGVPTGIQIVGRSYCDADVFRAGAGYEAALGGWYATTAARPVIG